MPSSVLSSISEMDKRMNFLDFLKKKSEQTDSLTLASSHTFTVLVEKDAREAKNLKWYRVGGTLAFLSSKSNRQKIEALANNNILIIESNRNESIDRSKRLKLSLSGVNLNSFLWSFSEVCGVSIISSLLEGKYSLFMHSSKNIETDIVCRSLAILLAINNLKLEEQNARESSLVVVKSEN